MFTVTAEKALQTRACLDGNPDVKFTIRSEKLTITPLGTASQQLNTGGSYWAPIDPAPGFTGGFFDTTVPPNMVVEIISDGATDTYRDSGFGFIPYQSAGGGVHTGDVEIRVTSNTPAPGEYVQFFLVATPTRTCNVEDLQ